MTPDGFLMTQPRVLARAIKRAASADHDRDQSRTASPRIGEDVLVVDLDPQGNA